MKNNERRESCVFLKITEKEGIAQIAQKDGRAVCATKQQHSQQLFSSFNHTFVFHIQSVDTINGMVRTLSTVTVWYGTT